jgi:hypothetical protein
MLRVRLSPINITSGSAAALVSTVFREPMLMLMLILMMIMTMAKRSRKSVSGGTLIDVKENIQHRKRSVLNAVSTGIG